MKEPRVRVAGILKKEDEILFVKHRKDEKEYYLLPGGGVDYGESFKVALEREFLEEVNLVVETGEMLFISEAIAPDSSKHIINLFFEVEYKSGEIKLTEEERLVGVEYLKVEELKKYIVYPNIKKELIDVYSKKSPKKLTYVGNIWE